jgi:hypothetical protein
MCPDRARTQTAASIPKGYYCRLFEPNRSPLSKEDEEKLVQLGESMRYTVEREGTLTPRVGFTYFGQFIGHDLTHDLTPLAGPYLDAERTPNYRSAYLNLEQLYGGGPTSSPHLYEGEPGAELFKIGETLREGYRRDLPIETSEVLIADRRDLDNLILRQLHVVFLKFHNEAVKQLVAKSLTTTGIDALNKGTVFERAQRLVRWHYQWIVRHDFLPRILHNSYWHFRSDARFREKGDVRFSISIEFSLAAFRFGHSMVRNAYGLNCRRPRVELTELMELGRRPSSISEDLVIEWGRFFDGLSRSGPVASSSYLDTSISWALHAMPPAILRLCIESEDSAQATTNLPVRTLLRGARSKLPSGQEVACNLLERGLIKPDDSLTPAQLNTASCNKSGTTLRKIGLDGNTPLFYYILKEAELSGAGHNLGPVGSWIVGTVIEGALKADPEGYMCATGASWHLPIWRFPDGTDKRVNNLIAIIRLIGDTQLLPRCSARVEQLLQPFRQAGR